MLKNEFLNLLAGQVDPAERDRVCGYYAEMIDDRVEAGQDEAAVIAGFGDVREIARTAEAQRKVREFNEKPSMSGGVKALIAAALLFASPIALPVVITLLAVVFTVLIVVFSLLCSLVATAAALAVGGAGGIIASAFFFASSPLSGLFMLGSALVCIGLGVVATWGSVKLLVLAAKGTWVVWKETINKIMRKKGGGGNENQF